MAYHPKFSDEAANAATDAICALLDGGKLRIFDGAQPGMADLPVGDQRLLAELTFGSPAFGAASGGVATATAITPDSDAKATSTATWFRCLAPNGVAIFDGSVGTVDCDMTLYTVSIVQHAIVSVTAFTFTARKA
jgi:hypothetical protein